MKDCALLLCKKPLAKFFQFKDIIEFYFFPHKFKNKRLKVWVGWCLRVLSPNFTILRF